MTDIIADAGVDVPRPEGAFYLFVPLEADHDAAQAETILENYRVSTTPGSAFGVPGYVRIACTVPEERLVDGVGRITQYLDSSGQALIARSRERGVVRKN